MHVSLTDKLDQYVRDKIATGLYNNASEVVRDALRAQIRAEEREAAQLDALKAQIEIGWQEAEQGQFATFDPQRIQRELDTEVDG